MKLPRYAEYKESGVGWIGRIPSHWTCTKLKHLLAGLGSGGTPDTDNASFWAEEGAEGVPWVSIGDMSGRTYVCETAKRVTQAGIDSKGLSVWPRGTLLFSMYASLGHTSELLLPAATNQAILSLVPHNEVDQQFLNFWLHFLRPNLVEQASSNTQFNLSADKVKNLVTLCPPRSDQIAITGFLHREIDALITEQEKLIRLLAEKRQATISHVVTSGLDPDAPKKDSRVAWFGQVPAHWAVGKCGFYLTVHSGYAFPSEVFSTDPTDTRLLRGINVGVAAIRWTETVYWRRLPNDGLDPYELQEGDLIIGMDRPLISEGMRVAQVQAADLPCLLLQRVAKLATGPLLLRDFLMRLLSSEMFVAHFSPDMTGVSVPHISPEQIGDFVIPIPPIREQEEISAFLTAEVEKLDALRAEAERAITLLKERRAALITAAVTGQIDVRGAVDFPVKQAEAVPA
jgi:type I restriction enzyme, S subunit